MYSEDVITFKGKIEEVRPGAIFQMVFVYKTDDGILWATQELAETWNKVRISKNARWFTRQRAFITQGDTERVWIDLKSVDADYRTVNLKILLNEEQVSSLRACALGKLTPKEREVLGLLS